MTLDEAISVMLDLYMTIPPRAPPHLRPAVNLLIQAGNHLQKQRQIVLPSKYPLLPGETEV